MWINEVFLDRRMTILRFFFLSYFVIVNSSWVDSLVFIGFSLLWRWFSIFFIVFFIILYGTTESYNATLVERHGFQEKNAYRLRNLGGILTLFMQSWIPFKKSGTAFSDFSFSRCCSLFFSDFSLFSRCVSLFFIDVSMSLHVFHYFSVFFQCFRDVFHYFSLSFG